MNDGSISVSDIGPKLSGGIIEENEAVLMASKETDYMKYDDTQCFSKNSNCKSSCEHSDGCIYGYGENRKTLCFSGDVCYTKNICQ